MTDESQVARSCRPPGDTQEEEESTASEQDTEQLLVAPTDRKTCRNAKPIRRGNQLMIRYHPPADLPRSGKRDTRRLEDAAQILASMRQSTLAGKSSTKSSTQMNEEDNAEDQ